MFVRYNNNNSLVLKGADVLRNNWFFLFVDAMNEMKVPVYGFEALRNFSMTLMNSACQSLGAIHERSLSNTALATAVPSPSIE